MADERGSGAEAKYVLEEMTTVEHLTEFRRRVIVAALSLAAGTAIGWIFVPDMLHSFTRDTGQTLVFISPAEGFTTHLKLALLAGFFLAGPIILAQAWHFVLPALFPHEQKLLRQYTVPALLLFVLGIVFGYVAVYPLALRFLLGFGTDQLEPVLSVARFVSFLVGVTLPFGLVFQLPVVLVVLVRLEIVSVQRLRALRRVIYLAAFIIGAVLTPPDVASQVLMAVPVILLYEITLWRLKKGGVGTDA